jgi:4-hydroxy-tetrahydrodipicolinate reductase
VRGDLPGGDEHYLLRERRGLPDGPEMRRRRWNEGNYTVRFVMTVEPSLPCRRFLPARRYRVVQWATGNVGSRSLRVVIEHPHLDLVGLYVHSADKVGRDAGELCGLSPIGIKATNRVDDIVGLKPDCVIYMQQGFNADDVCRLLAAGINVVTTRDEVQYANAMEPALRARIEEACQRGGSSIHATGSSPGFINEAVPLVLLSLQRRLDTITIDEFADLSSRNSPELLFNVMGFGAKQSSFDDRRLNHLKDAVQPSLRLVADAIGTPLEGVSAQGEVGLAREDMPVAAGVVRKGTIAATRISVSGMRNGRPFLTQRLNWYCGTNIDQPWQLRESGWRLLVEGDMPLDVAFRFPVPPERYAETTPGLTAHRAVNAVPFVCEAPPGLRSTLDLPYIVPAFS